MSEILIKGMKMPKGCNECRFHDGSWCCAQPIENWRDSYYRPPEGEKQTTCPLVEVQTHGDLIERSEVVSCLDRHIKFNLEQDNDISAVRALSFAEADVLRDGKGIYKKYPICIPTVIEASN